MARSAAVALLITAAVGAAPPAAGASWGRPFRLAAPFSLDILAPQVAFSQSGAAAVAFRVQDADNPATSTGYVSRRSSGGRVSRPRRVSGAQQVLGLAFDGGALELLTGHSSAGEACCGSAAVVGPSAGGSFGRSRRLLSGLAGATAGQLLSVSGRLVAAIATERGVWVAQSGPGGDRFGRLHLLTGSDARPEALSAAPLAAGGAIVAWIERDRRSSVPRKLFVASGTTQSAPAAGRSVRSVPNGHRIDELAVVGSSASSAGSPPSAGPTLAWIESWYDGGGAYHSQLEVADLAHATKAKSFPIPGEIAAGLSFSQDAKGDQLLAWKACSPSGTCSVREALRRVNHRFTGQTRLGSIDPAEVPTASLSGSGAGLVGWIDQGHVLAAAVRPGAARFAGRHTISDTNFGADLDLGFGPTGAAIAVWSQGTLAPEVIGAVYRP